jgi:hypothetical protein
MDTRRNPFPLLQKESSLSMKINKESGVVKSLKDGVFFVFGKMVFEKGE